MALNLINKLYGIERDLKEASDTERFEAPSNAASRSSNNSKPGWTKPSRRSLGKLL